MVSAMLNDPDLAEAIAAATDDEDEEAAPSSLRSQTPEVILLRGIFNLIVSALGGKEMWPAPVTAVDRARDQLDADAAADVIAAMTPWALPDLLADDGASAPVLVSTQQALADLLTADASVDAADAQAEPSAGLVSERSAAAGRTAEVLGAVRSALRNKRRLHVTYVSATDTLSERDIDPIALESDGSHMTLVAWCLSARAERSFRLDRIESIQVLDVPAVRHRTSRRKNQPESDRPAGERPRATLTLRPSGRWLTEQIPCVSREEGTDGRLRAVVEGRDRAWLIGLVLSAGYHLIAVEPADLAQDAAAAAKRALTSYDADTE